MTKQVKYFMKFVEETNHVRKDSVAAIERECRDRVQRIQQPCKNIFEEMRRMLVANLAQQHMQQ